MKLHPCTDDLISLFAIYPVILLCEGLLVWSCDWNTALITALLLLDLLLLLNSLRAAVYFSRTITLTGDGLMISLFSHRRVYPWSSLIVTLHDSRGLCFHDSDRAGRGILIYPKSSTPAKHLSPMTACLWLHPIQSVFLRFQTDAKPTASGKIMYKGYTVSEKEILDFLKHIEVI